MPSAFDGRYLDDSPRDRMATAGFKINPLIGLLGLITATAGLIADFFWLALAGALICAGGMTHVYFQLQNDELRSTLYFNSGVRKFNRRHYIGAGASFKKALGKNPSNELAKYGLYKVDLYK
jgi:hypothetical protein